MSDHLDPVSSASREQDLALALAVTIRTGAYYDPDNAVLQQACALLASLLVECMGSEDSVTVGVHSHCVFVNKARVRTTVATYGRFAYLIQLFEYWNLNTLTFLRRIDGGGVDAGRAPARPAAPGRIRIAEILRIGALTGCGGSARGKAEPQTLAQLEAYAAACNWVARCARRRRKESPLTFADFVMSPRRWSIKSCAIPNPWWLSPPSRISIVSSSPTLPMWPFWRSCSAASRHEQVETGRAVPGRFPARCRQAWS